jgi:D-glycero-D-manno-heptose 1,7-bisphosphate phosphatase
MQLVILDRDGVINQDSDAHVKSPAEWRPIPGSLEAIARLNRSGWRVVVATNQSGVGRGLFDIETLNAIHERMRSQLAEIGGTIDAIFFCPHRPQDRCECRKPKPGLLQDIAARLRISLAGVPAIGDSRRDVEAALAAGARPILVRTGKGERTLAEHGNPEDVPVFDDLAAAAEALLAETQSPARGPPRATGQP